MTKIFGDVSGQKVYEYVFDIYLKNRTEGSYNDSKVSKTIDNIIVDYGHEPDQGSSLVFHFSYLQ
ncbi:hypothetical protein D3C87_2068620 [compost metagenome]